MAKSKGPRYCPSIEDKVMNFPEKKEHQLFLQPESRVLDTLYLHGFFTSFSLKIQKRLLKTIPALKNCKIVKWGYAIEYDALNSTQLKATLETKRIKGLYTAGQINGTSGYEEAAAQGLIAGINAFLKIKKKRPFLLKREESYIGVLIDDLITKGTLEPYRLLSLQAENRLCIRNDNVETRLLKKAFHLGIITKKNWNLFLKKRLLKQKIKFFLKKTKILPNSQFSTLIKEKFAYNLKKIVTGQQLLRYGNVYLKPLLEILSFPFSRKIFNFNDFIEVQTDIKYAPYIKQQKKIINDINSYAKLKIPSDFEYHKLTALSKISQKKLNEISPLDIGQAMRIPGVPFADIQTLFTYLTFKKRKFSTTL